MLNKMMFGFTVLLSFGGSLATKCLSLSNEPCMATPTLIHLNPIELNYYPFIISLDKCNGSCNAINDLSMKISVPSKTKHVNVIVFNMITRRNKAKILVKYYSCYCKWKFNS